MTQRKKKPRKPQTFIAGPWEGVVNISSFDKDFFEVRIKPLAFGILLNRKDATRLMKWLERFLAWSDSQ